MDYKELKKSDKSGIHEVLFQMNILELEDDDKVEDYFNKLPEDIKKNGIRYGFNDTVVQDCICEWFENNVL